MPNPIPLILATGFLIALVNLAYRILIRPIKNVFEWLEKVRGQISKKRQEKLVKYNNLYLTRLEAFKAMSCFLEKYYEETQSDDVGALLGEMQILEDRDPFDTATWHDWMNCVKKVVHRRKYLNPARHLHKEIHSILLRDWDPIGIQDTPQAQDEYDSYIPVLYKLLISGKSEQNIVDYLWWVETEHMGLYANRRHTEIVARKLLTLQR
jgi:hypothetical protein